ncbi:hypothetical protein GCM10009751_35950 [Myceligenerans crystallogenes]|uniref:Uncharacterized protein n=1 Tax=Myceligenerans crystallogenes TaxID=316335 RepID=A0ABN2NKN1_9MICO
MVARGTRREGGRRRTVRSADDGAALSRGAGDVDPVARGQLAPPAGLRLAVDPDVPADDELARLGAVLGEVRQLEELPEPDRTVPDGDALWFGQGTWLGVTDTHPTIIAAMTDIARQNSIDAAGGQT